MKKVKIVVVILLAVIIAYSIFITVEVSRFNNNLGVKPLITIGTIDVNIKAGTNITEEKINGIGYTIEYEHLVKREETTDIQIDKVISGQFKLFDKFILSSWIE